MADTPPPGPAWLNYHHLLYFWTIVREGGVSRAAEKLRLSQPTISAQIRRLEDVIGAKLLRRDGRTVAMTDVGQLVFRYADELFSIGTELMETLRGRPATGPAQLTVGVANAVPKLIVYKLLSPATRKPQPFSLVCREDNMERLLAELASHALDVLITDTPVAPHARIKVFNHLLGESDTAFFSSPRRAAALRRRFPASLDHLPVLLPTRNTALRQALDQWFERDNIHPRVVGQFEDSALLKVFGQAGDVVFPAPAAIAADVCRVYGVREIGRTAAARERYYAISAERRVTHPGVLAITSAGRGSVFKASGK